MCGFGGKFYFDRERTVEESILTRMTSVMAHRGPDGRGIYRDGPLGLCHRRLAIIDLASGNQPMETPDGRLRIAYNGEIYNYREIRRELQARGYQFRTQSDTEVVLNAYSAWGTRCLERFNGMFAFALWDQATQTLLLARDPLGIKPVYYYQGPDRIVFASEIRAVLQDSDVPRRLDLQGLSDYLSLGYVLAPKTLFRDIAKLLPGHFLTWTNGCGQVRPYWDLAGLIRNGSSMQLAGESSSGLLDQLQEHLDRAVTAQLVSDVPVGAFLSGGIDSSTVVQKMMRRVGGPVRTFSVGFDEPTYNELPYAQEVAEFLGTEHKKLVVRPDLNSLLPEIARLAGEPLGDSSLVPTYCVSRLAREEVKVVLSGDGGDEIFAGYDTYIADRLHRYYHRIPRWLRQWGVEPVMNGLPSTFRKVSFDYKAKQFVAAGDLDSQEAHYSWRELFSEAEKREILHRDLFADLEDYRPFGVFQEYFREVEGADALAQMQYVDIKTWLADDILVKVDRASMAHGLETRVPLLDHELVQFAITLPSRFKIHGLEKKFLLKKAMASALPSRIVHRRKSGFNAPVGPWLCGPLRGFFQDVMLDGKNGVLPLNQSKLQTLLTEHLARRRDHGYRLWSLLMLGLWADGLSV